MDAEYYNKLNNDMSLPLFNNATQAQKAPGSTFKPIMAVAALEEKAIGLSETVNCTGMYQEITPHMRCWIYPGQHGPLDAEHGIMNSCNVFFADMGHRLSMDENGTYSPELGIEKIRKYAAMFGLDETSGIEISEKSSPDDHRKAGGLLHRPGQPFLLQCAAGPLHHGHCQPGNGI